MKKLFAVTALLATSVAGVAATGGLANADENAKLYPAFGCLETGTGGGTTINRNEVRITKSSGGVNETAFVLCPIVRDERSSGFFGSVSAVVHVSNTILNKNLSCTLTARHHANGPITFQTKTTSGVNSAGEDLVLGSLLVNSHDGGQDAFYYIQCEVPTNQGGGQVVKIFSYEVTEH